MEIMLESLMVSERREYLQEEGIADTLYTKGLTQEQVGEVFNDIYGEHYSKASMSRMRGAMPNEESVILLMGKDCHGQEVLPEAGPENRS